MNCEPDQWATIVAPCEHHECVGIRLGSPVHVKSVSLAITRVDRPAPGVIAMGGIFIWELHEPRPSCPFGECSGLNSIPDRCLKPFDSGSAP